MSRTVPSNVDSLGKLFHRIALVAKDKVTLNGSPLYEERQVEGRYRKLEVEPPQSVVVSPSVMREMTCVAGCTACCLPFTLDFMNVEWNTLWDSWADEIKDEANKLFYTREVTVSGVTMPVQTYDQFKDESCPFLRPTREGGALGCGFYTGRGITQPLECASAPNLLMTTRGAGNTVLMKRPFGYGWKWEQSPQCEFDPVVDRITNIPDTFDLSYEIALLERYQAWATYFQISTYIPGIVEVLQDFPAQLRESQLRSVRVA